MEHSLTESALFPFQAEPTPEPEAAIRAAWILGERHESKPVSELIRTLQTTSSGYLAEAPSEALGKIRDNRATAALEYTAINSPVRTGEASRIALLHLRRDEQPRSEKKMKRYAI